MAFSGGGEEFEVTTQYMCCDVLSDIQAINLFVYMIIAIICSFAQIAVVAL